MRKITIQKNQFNFPASPATQTVMDTGCGRALKITLSHKETDTQTVRFYDRNGLVLAEYHVHPQNCPFTITIQNRDSFDFSNGLKVNTGACSLNLILVY
jgi:hypothetical protein